MSFVIWNHKHRYLHQYSYSQFMPYHFRPKRLYATAEKYRARENAAYMLREMGVLVGSQFDAVLACPPIGLASTYDMRRCHLWHYCPSCYALELGSVYDTLVPYLGRMNRFWTYVIPGPIDQRDNAMIADDLTREAKALQRELKPWSFAQIRFPVGNIQRNGLVLVKMVVVAVRHRRAPAIRKHDARSCNATKLGLAKTLKALAYPKQLAYDTSGRGVHAYHVWSLLRKRIHVYHEPDYRFTQRLPRAKRAPGQSGEIALPSDGDAPAPLDEMQSATDSSRTGGSRVVPFGASETSPRMQAPEDPDSSGLVVDLLAELAERPKEKVSHD